ncbi:MAG TPA: hypothetical protein VJN88_11370 [Ktedonobacterales bacterium]|nr:hypothetical protein [Ktedonobacterales bacterium]
MNIIVNGAVTLLVGVIGGTVGAWLQGVFIGPLSEQKKVRRDIAYNLEFYAHVYGSPGIGPDEELREVYASLRDNGVRLGGTLDITCYALFERVHLVLPQRDVRAAAKDLKRLANQVLRANPEFTQENPDLAKRIRMQLKFPVN